MLHEVCNFRQQYQYAMKRISESNISSKTKTKQNWSKERERTFYFMTNEQPLT
jgi:hypothetical protein